MNGKQSRVDEHMLLILALWRALSLFLSACIDSLSESSPGRARPQRATYRFLLLAPSIMTTSSRKQHNRPIPDRLVRDSMADDSTSRLHLYIPYEMGQISSVRRGRGTGWPGTKEVAQRSRSTEHLQEYAFILSPNPGTRSRLIAQTLKPTQIFHLPLNA